MDVVVLFIVLTISIILLMRQQKSSLWAQLLLIKLEKEESKLLKLKEQYIETFEEIRVRLISVNPDIYSDLLYMRYLEQKTLVQIADELNYSYEWTCRLHGRALLAFSRIYHT